MREYRVLLIEQNRIMLERLSSVIRSTKDFQLVSRSADAREALSQGSVFLPNLILLDVDMADNVQLVRDFVKAFPQAVVLCLGSQWSAQAAGNAVKAGAKGYLIKPFTGEELIAAVHTFGSGGMESLSEVLTFFSPKGKSGKTTLVANLALALARQTGQPVAIIDADLQFDDMAIFFNLEPQTTLVEAARDIAFLSPISLNAYFTPVNDQVKVLCGTKRPEFAESVGPRALTEIISMARSLFRYILIDVPPAFNPASVAAAEAADRVYLVAMVSGGYEVTHMRRALEIFQAWPDYAAKIRAVFTRAEPKQRETLEAELGYPVCAVLPNEYLLVAAAANNGRMAVDIKLGSPLTGAIDSLAAQICHRSGAG